MPDQLVPTQSWVPGQPAPMLQTTLERWKDMGDGSFALVVYAAHDIFDDWYYPAPAGGKSSTAAVTLRAAPGAGRSVYLQSVAINSTPIAAISELIIRSTPSNTVLFRVALPLVGITSGLAVSFDPPIMAPENEAVEYLLNSTITLGSVYMNAQGYVDSFN